MELMQSLGINPVAVLWHTANFLLLLVVLRLFLYRPILRMLDERSTRIRTSMAQVETWRAETARLEEESRAILENARREAQHVLAQTNRTAERIIGEAQRQAKEEANRVLERARAELARERDQAFQELRQGLADIAVLAASRVIRRSLDGPTQRQIVQEFLASGTPDGKR
ncbi:MAG: F0F1 ATP synthase subunit B [Chloroflexi bacterium]|nr:F0F1 ATP synthase subunit B [Chloroflexota bacterium]